MYATETIVIEENNNIHLGRAHIECATAHQLGKVNGSVNVNKMNAFSIAFKPAVTRPNIAKV